MLTIECPQAQAIARDLLAQLDSASRAGARAHAETIIDRLYSLLDSQIGVTAVTKTLGRRALSMPLD